MKMNPVLKNEMKIKTRTVKIPWMIFLFNTVLTIIGLYIFYHVNQTLNSGLGANYFNMLTMYVLLAYVELVMLLFIVPTLTAGSITGERERQTFDILLTTNMSPWEIIWGKLQACISVAILLVISSLPVISLTFIYGGIGIGEVFVLIIALILCAVYIGSIGIFFSSITKKTSIAAILTYITIVLIFAGTLVGVYLLWKLKAIGMESLENGEAVDIGNVVYIWLLNPLINFSGLLSYQTGDHASIMKIFRLYGDYEGNLVVLYWLPISSIIQSIIAVLLLWLSSHKINPLRKKH